MLTLNVMLILFSFFLKHSIGFRVPLSTLSQSRVALTPVRLTSSKFNQQSVKSNPLRASESEIISRAPLESADVVPKKLGVLLLNLGGPEKLEDVEGFLYNLFADPDIIRLPSLLSSLQKPLALLISKSRAPKSSAAYASIGGGSPILKYTREQAALLTSQLRQRGYNNANAYIAMRYWQPYTEDALAEVLRDNITDLVVLPLYPQYSISTTGSSLKYLNALVKNHPQVWAGDKIKLTVVPQWYQRPGYIASVANLLAKEISSLRSEGGLPPSDHSPASLKRTSLPQSVDLAAPIDVLFSAHGVPKSYIDAGDPYQTQIQDCFKKVCDATCRILNSSEPLSLSPEPGASACSSSSDYGAVNFHLSYQSRVGPIEWLRPYTDDAIRSLGNSGARNLIVVPISFVSEHIETLEEIDGEYRELAKESGISSWRRVPALNTDERFIDELCDVVVSALRTPRVSIDEALVLPSSSVNAKPSLLDKLSTYIPHSVSAFIQKLTAK